MGKQTNNLIGQIANIKKKVGDSAWNDEFYGAWGRIVHFDGDYYHIQMYCSEHHDTAPAIILERNEFTIKREK